jgi:hypothetical protein
MEDLADEECVVPIFIRCLGHLWGDAKFGQIDGGRRLAGDHRVRGDTAVPLGRSREGNGAIGPSGGPDRPPDLAERHGTAGVGRTRSVRICARPPGVGGQDA